MPMGVVPMPKLVVKYDTPTPSLQERLEGWLRTIFPLLFLLLISATAVAFYVAQRAATVALPPSQAPVSLADRPQETARTSMLAVPDKTTIVAEPVASVPNAAQQANLPKGFCPLNGPGAAECRANAKKQ